MPPAIHSKFSPESTLRVARLAFTGLVVFGCSDTATEANETTSDTANDSSSPAPRGTTSENTTPDGVSSSDRVTPSSSREHSSNNLLEQARVDYRGWQPRTADPVPISAQIFTLCRVPSAAENAFVDSIHGAELFLWDWLNSEARDGIAAIEADTSSRDAVHAFPVGATIVKEKLAHVGGSRELAALGIMLKREPGFNPTNGDWQFGYWEPGVGMSASVDDQAYCGECHAFAATDFVYVDDSWRLPEPTQP